MPIYVEQNMRYVHFDEVNNAAISEICGNRILG